MSSRVGLVFGYRAVGIFQGTAGGGAWLKSRGFTVAMIVRNAAGDYTLTVDEPLDVANASQGFLLATSDGAVNANIDAVIASANTVRVRSGVAGVLTDMIFTIAIIDLGPN